MSTHLITDNGDPRRYYTTIPNIIFTLGLTPHELTFYLYLKKVAGEEGTCWQSTTTFTKALGMGRATISRTKASLARPRTELGGKPLIVIQADKAENGAALNHAITITDIWPENMAELEHLRNEKSAKPSVHPQNQGVSTKEQGVPVENPKNTYSKNNPGKKKKDLSKPRDPRLDHPALKAVIEVKGRYPHKDTWDAIIETLGTEPDIPRLKQCWTLWRVKDYNPQNLSWLTDWYVHGPPPPSVSATDSSWRFNQFEHPNAYRPGKMVY